MTTDDKDIVDHLSEATGHFHDDDAARLRDIADSGGQKPVGVVRAGVEKEIERREWRCVHFEHDEDDEYPSRNPYEYYRIHKRYQKEYEAAMDALPTEEKHMRETQVHENAYQILKDKAREHEAKANAAERYLEENGEYPEAVLTQ